LSDSTAAEETCLASSSGLRTATLMTCVQKRIRSVTAAIVATAMNGSTKGVSSFQSRLPSLV